MMNLMITTAIEDSITSTAPMNALDQGLQPHNIPPGDDRFLDTRTSRFESM